MRLKLKDLQPGKKYSIQLRTVTSDAVSEWSRKFTFDTVTDDTKPRTPTGLTLTPTSTSFSAEWNRVTKDVAGEDVGIDHYEVEWSSPDSAVTKVYETKGLFYALSIEQNRSVFGITKANVGVRVRAVNRHDVASDWSAIVGANNNPPAMPQNLTATAIMDGVVLSWDANTTDDDLRGYRVYVGSTADFIPNITNMVFEGDATTYTYYSSTYSEHFFKVTAFDEFDIESAPATASATPISPFVWDETPPNAPSNFTGTISGNTINLSWDYVPADDPDDLASFQIRWRATTDTATQPDPANPTGPAIWVYRDLRILPANARQLQVTDIDNVFLSYEFEIRSVDETNNASAWTGPITVTAGDGVVPNNPTVDVRAGQSTLEFDVTDTLGPDLANGHGVWHYDISTSNTFPAGSTYHYDTGQTSLVVTGLDENTTYYYRVSVTDAEGLTSTWTSASVATLAFPLPPGPTDGYAPAKVGTVSTVSGLAAITALWPAVTTNSNGDAQPDTSPIVYEIHASTTTGFTPAAGTLVTQSGGTSAIITKVGGTAVTAGTNYYIKVIAKDADGLGTPSDEVTGTSRKVVGNEVETITAGQIATGSLASAIITMAAGGVIQSNNYVAGSAGYKLDETGLTIYNGTVSATALKGGTVSSTTLNIGAGGVINVDSTAVIKSNNYAAGSTGWQLSSSGLEVNGTAGSISASSIKAGNFSAGVIYVASGGSIQDANGYWSITPSAINIQNGSINAATITSGSLRSTKAAYDYNGNAIAGQYAWQIDTQGDAVFGNAYVRGRIIVGTSTSTGSGAIQSNYYYPGSSGWKIDSNGSVEFNQATVNAGMFRSQNASQRVEMGNTGAGDPADEVRMFNNGGVVSMRHITGSLGWVYFNLYNGAASLHPTSDGWVAVQRGSVGPMLKFVSAGLQVRDSADSAYTTIQASAFTVSSESKFKTNISTVPVDTTTVLKGNGLYKWKWADSQKEIDYLEAKPPEAFAPSTMAMLDDSGNPLPEEDRKKKHKALGQKAKVQQIQSVMAKADKEDYGLIADNLPDWLRTEDGYSVTAVTAFLWEALKQSNERLDALEKKLSNRP